MAVFNNGDIWTTGETPSCLNTPNYTTSNFPESYYAAMWGNSYAPYHSPKANLSFPSSTRLFYEKLLEFYKLAKPDFFSLDRNWAGMEIGQILAELNK
ncbi:MAG: hypothetical protein PHW73_02335 [Atribacterota bacterium]|nr:hypothetical protein [Atribacterota bacterium]